MKLLFTGRGTSGSWQMRGIQLGRAMGADVRAMVTQGNYDLAVVVKRVPPELLGGLKRWVWDIVDAFPQPTSYAWTRERAQQWFRDEVRRLKPSAIIWPTRRMREDCDPGLPGLVLPHHHQPGLNRDYCDPLTVGYQGGENYLGTWRPMIERQCLARGLRFLVNPHGYETLGTVIAVRDGGGYVCRHWKSGVKHSNALAIGAKFIANRESGYEEQATGQEYWADTIEQLAEGLDRAVPLVGKPYTMTQAAMDLHKFLYAL